MLIIHELIDSLRLTPPHYNCACVKIDQSPIIVALEPKLCRPRRIVGLMLLSSHRLLVAVVTWVRRDTSVISKNNKGRMKCCKEHSALLARTLMPLNVELLSWTREYLPALVVNSA